MHALLKLEIREGVYQRFHPQAEQEYLAAQPEVPRIIYCRAPAGLWHSPPARLVQLLLTFQPPRTAQTEETACSPGHPSAKPERTQAWDNRGRSHSRRPHNRSGNWVAFCIEASPSALQKKEDVRTHRSPAGQPSDCQSADGIEAEAKCTPIARAIMWSAGVTSSALSQAWVRSGLGARVSRGASCFFCLRCSGRLER